MVDVAVVNGSFRSRFEAGSRSADDALDGPPAIRL